MQKLRILLVVLLILLLALPVYGAPKPAPGTTTLTNMISALTVRVEALEAQVTAGAATIQELVRNAEATDVIITALLARISDLEEAVDGLQIPDPTPAPDPDPVPEPEPPIEEDDPLNPTIPPIIILNPQASWINVRSYGAVGNGIADDSVAIQEAALYCTQNEKIMYIPPGTYKITAAAMTAKYGRRSLDLSCDIECEGKLTWEVSASPNSTPYVEVQWQKSAVTVNPATVGGMTKGSTQITGLPSGYIGGTVIIDSDEELIKRVWAVDPFYKMEASFITGNSGQIWPPLMHTYDTAQIGAGGLVIQPPEKPLEINGLWLEATGVPSQAVYLLLNYKDNVTYNDLKLVQESAPSVPLDGAYGIVVRGCGITLNNPIITGQNSGGTDGYGVMSARSANLTINNPYMVGSDSHAITGGGDKRVRVNGGYCATDAPTNPAIDSHWGSDMVIDGTKIDGGVAYAGEDITIRNATYVNCIRLLLVRSDSPELTGDVLIENCTIEDAYYADSAIFYAFQYINQDTPIVFDFGRTLGAPDSVAINDITILDPGGSGAYFQVFSQAHAEASYANPIAEIGSKTYSNITWAGGTVYPDIP